MDGTAAPDQAPRRSLAEQLSPLAARLAASRSLTFPVLQIAADLPGPAAEAGPRAEAILQDWLARQAAPHKPPEAIASAEPWMRALQWQVPDETFSGRLWRMETVLCLTGDPAQPTASLACRLSCTVSGEAHGVVPWVPGFIGEIAEEIGLIADGRRLASLPQAVEAAEVDALVRLILAPERRLPVLVLAHTINAELLVDPAALAARCLGLAHVALLGVDAGFALTRLLGKQWSVFDGGLRLYLPGCAPERQSRFDHPLVLGRDLRALGESEARLDDLLRRAARASLRETAAEQGAGHVPGFADLRARLADSELHRRLSAAPDAGERGELLEQRLRALDAEMRVLREEREQSIALALEYEQQALQAAQEVAEERREKFALRARLAQLERRPVGAGFAEAPRPFGYDCLAEWVEQQFTGRLVLSSKAKRALADAVFADIPLVCDALELLAGDYVTMRRAGSGREAFEAALQRLHLRDEMIAASPQRHRREPQYLCQYEGQELFTDRHLKKGNSYDPRESLRIYYAWEPVSQQVVIGHLTSHLETEVS